MKRIAILVAVLALAGCSSSNKSGSNDSGSQNAISQVKITKCAKDGLGNVEVKGTATNDASQRSDFTIDIAVTSANGVVQIGTTRALAKNVEPGKTDAWESPTTVKFKAGAVCRVAAASRTNSP